MHQDNCAYKVNSLINTFAIHSQNINAIIKHRLSKNLSKKLYLNSLCTKSINSLLSI